MSTEINIKKRIDIQEEGVSITPDVNSINFIGDGVTASAIGDDVTVNIPGGTGTITYYLNESVTQTPYKEFTSTLTASAEQTIVTSIASGATVTIQSFQTPSGVPGTTNIPGGRWAFYLHFSGTTGDSWDVFADVYKRDLGGIETLLLTTDAVPTSTLTGTAVMLLTDGVFPASTVLTTDRIVVKVRVTNTDSTTNSITFHTEGNTNYSVATTTLNQVIPTGSVTSVTGTAPIVSSGGTTPAISIPQATALVDGYLDSADFALFNGKQDPITLTTLTSSGAATFIANVLNIPNYTLSGLGGVPTTRNLTINGVSFDLSADRSWTVGTVTSVQLAAGTGISLAGTNPITSSGTITVTNSAPDQTVVLNAGSGIGVTGTYPNFTISNTDPTTGVTLTSAGGTETLVNDGTGPALATKGITAGTGISLSSTATDLTVTNAAPDQVVTLTAGTNIGITGTYPNFTIDNTAVTPSGKIGITDSNGVFTYYSTLPAACAAAVSGQTITLFTDVTETTATVAALPNGVDLNLNGYSYILDVAGPTNAVETTGGGSRNNIYNGKIIRRNVGGSSFLIGVCLRNRCSALNMYGVELINEDDCTALVIEESGTVNGSWSARCDGANASGVTVDSGYNPFIYNGTITSQGVGVYVETGSSVNIYDSFIQSGSIAIQSAQDVSVYNSTVLASSNTGIEITSGTLIMDRSFVFASSGGAISISSGTMNISLSRIGSVGANGISLGTITGNIELIGSHITTLNGANNFAIENLQAYKVDISNNYFYIQGTGTRRNLSFANTSDAGNANIDVKNNTLEVVSSGIAGSAGNIYFGNYLSGSYKVSGNELKCQSPSAAARCIRTNGFPLTMAYVSNILKITNGQNPIDLNITQGNGFTPDLYGNIQTDY
jgi:hypothetical protein